MAGYSVASPCVNTGGLVGTRYSMSRELADQSWASLRHCLLAVLRNLSLLQFPSLRTEMNCNNASLRTEVS